MRTPANTYLKPGMDRTPGPVTVPVQKFAILFRSGPAENKK